MDLEQNTNGGGVADASAGTVVSGGSGTPSIASASAGGQSSGVSAQVASQGGGQSAQVNRALLDALAASGKCDPSGFDSDDALLESIGKSLGDLQFVDQYRHFAPATYEYLTERELYQKWKAEQQSQAKQSKPDEPEAPDPWAKIEYDKQWDDMVARDPETGRWVPKNHFIPPEVAMKREAYDRQVAERVRSLANDPLGFLKPGFDRHLAPLVKQMIEEQINQVYQRQAAWQFLSNHKQSWVVHQNGQPVFDPATGQEMLTPAGLHALRVSQELSAIPGLTYEQREKLLDLSMAGFYRDNPSQQSPSQQQQVVAQQTPAEKKSQFLDSIEARQRGAGVGPRGSTSEAVAGPGTKRFGRLDETDFASMADRRMREQGLISN